MAKYYEVHKAIIVATTLSGVYFPGIEEIYGDGLRVKLLRLMCIFSWGSLPLYIVSELKYLVFDEDEMVNKLFGCTLLLGSITMGYSLFFLQYYKKDFVRLFELWDSMFQEELYSDEREELLSKNRKITNKWLIGSGGTSAVSTIFYCIMTYFKKIKKLNHPTGIPYRHESPDFELMNTWDLIAGVFGLIAMVTFDCMTMTFLSMEEAQLRHLKRSLGRIVDVLSVTEDGHVLIESDYLNYSEEDDWKIKTAAEDVERKLRIWLKHHQQLLGFHNMFQRVISIPLCAKFAIFVLELCFFCILTLVGKFSVMDLMFSVSFCAVSYGVFYVNVMFADSIFEEAATIFEDAFEKSWYLYPKSVVSTFHIIQMNSYRPLRYKALNFYNLSSENFLNILWSAYSFFTFVNDTSRKK